MAHGYIKVLTSWRQLICLLLLLLTGAQAKGCPFGMDPLCTSCNAADECISCRAGYFPNPNPGFDQCFACSEGCLLCSSSVSCSKCQSEGFYLEQGYCWSCKSGCSKCVDDDSCQECDDQYFAVKGHCTLLKMQVYIAIACLGALIILIVGCCYALIKVKSKPDANETFYSHIPNKSIACKTISINILDDETKRDTEKINDVETIGRVDKGGSMLKLSFIQGDQNPNIMEEEAQSNKKQIDFSKSFLVA